MVWRFVVIEQINDNTHRIKPSWLNWISECIMWVGYDQDEQIAGQDYLPLIKVLI